MSLPSIALRTVFCRCGQGRRIDPFGRQRAWPTILGIILLLGQMGVSLPALASIVYVGAQEEHKSIQDGIDAAEPGDTVIVRNGVYTGPGNRSILFNKAVTVRSQNGPQKCIISGSDSDIYGFNFDGVGSKASLSGFTIQGFNEYGGAGIYCIESSAQIRNCIITGNQRGIYCLSSSPQIENCVISANGYDGISCYNSSPQINQCTILENFDGIYCEDESSPRISDCVILNNGSDGISCYNASPDISRCTIKENGSDGINSYRSSLKANKCTIMNNAASGVACLFSSSVKISNCLILDNERGIDCYYSSPKIANCTISGNNDGIYCSYSSTPKVINNIFWGNKSQLTLGGTIENPPLVSYSCIQGGWPGTGNVSSNPLFFDSAHEIFYLRPNSPCINKGVLDTEGLPDEDKDGNPRIMDGRVDMGAYEYGPRSKPGVSLASVEVKISEKRSDPVLIPLYRANGSASDSIKVRYQLIGKAKEAKDYQEIKSTVVIPAGDRSAVISITPINDSVREKTETITIQLLESKDYRLLEVHEAMVRIADND